MLIGVHPLLTPDLLKVLADTPRGAVQIVRDRYPRSRGHEVLARHTHHDVADLRADMDRDKVFTAAEAVAYGLADEVLRRRVV